MTENRRNEQLKQLAEMINHDMRTPLSNIRSAATFLLKDQKDPITDSQRAFLEIIERATIRLLDQSNRLMLLSELAFSNFRQEPTQVSELLAYTRRVLKSSYDIDSLTLNCQGDPTLSCDKFILATTLALLAVGDTKHQTFAPDNESPQIETRPSEAGLCFKISSLMPAHKPAQSLFDLSKEVVALHGGELEILDLDQQKQFAFCLPTG